MSEKQSVALKGPVAAPAAKAHAAPLNVFPEEVRQLAMDAGGRWEVLDVDDVAVNYQHIRNATGAAASQTAGQDFIPTR